MSLPLLHVLAGDDQAGRADFMEVVGRLQEACGADLALHLRLRDASTSRLLELASVITRAAEGLGGWCVVNERLDVALAAGAQAAQLGRRALPLSAARRVAGGRLRLGVSVHDEREARDAVRGGANYVVLGTIYPTGTHPEIQPHGPRIVERCCNVGAPVVAIGGVDSGRVPELRSAGASGVAVIRAVWDAGDPVQAAERLIDAWRTG
ncbi:MAG: thiamine phosphate synthase [Gemmatimonadetes bacterium]|nr:thiamine phosphate synthase [Gemmatimonadota bacterium]